MSDAPVSVDAGLLRALRALSNPVRLQLLQWLREPERHFPLEGAIADPIEVGVCVSHIQARTGLAQSTVSAYMAELEELGWRAFWIPELLGREAFSHAGYLLSCTERMSVVNGIAQIWSRGAKWTYGASRLLADAYPGRHVLGLGFGGPRPGTTPLT